MARAGGRQPSLLCRSYGASRSLLVVEDALAVAARGARESIWLGFEPGHRARPGEGRADRVDGSTMEANAALRTIVRVITGLLDPHVSAATLRAAAVVESQ